MIDNTALFRALIKLAQKDAEQQEQNNEQTKLKSSTQHFCLYNSHAHQILADISELRNLVLDKRKEYILCSNAFSLYGAQRYMSDEDRKKFDRETDMAIRQCTKLIRDLEIQINSDQSLRTSDEQKHLLTAVSLLNSYLKDVLAIVAQLRKIHIRKTRQIRKICRLANLVDMYGDRLADAQKEEEAQEAKLSRMKQALEQNEKRQESTLGKENIATTEDKGFSPILLPKKEISDAEPSTEGWDDANDMPKLHEEPPEMVEANNPNVSTSEGWTDAELDFNFEPAIESKSRPSLPKKLHKQLSSFHNKDFEQPIAYTPVNRAEQTQLVSENKKLFDRFASTDAELQRIESQVAEIQRLQNMFAEKISEQEQDIDTIHSRSVYTLDNLEHANDFIREAIKNQANRRVIMIFCLLVLTFTLLFLHWYNP